jgi:anti-anti-sigma factor
MNDSKPHPGRSLIESSVCVPIPRIQFERRGGCLVARLEGTLDIYNSQRIVELLSALDPQDGDVVVDLAQVRMIDSAGLNALYSTADALRRSGRVLVVRCPDGPVGCALRVGGALARIDVVSTFDAIEQAGRLGSEEPQAAAGERPTGLGLSETAHAIPDAGRHVRAS